MFRLAPIDNDFVPYSRRPVRKNNGDLFVRGGRRGAAAGVALQVSAPYSPPYQPYPCFGKRPGDSCGLGLICNANLDCVPSGY
jgi:hypothetical protein